MKYHRPMYECPGCGRYVQAVRLIDCRALPDAPIDWACDGCFSSWRRKGIRVHGNKDPKNKHEWSEQWLEAHNAPQSAKKAHRDKEAKHHRKDYRR